MFERATRLCRMSPRIVTFSPSSVPRRSRIVSASSSACVGCSAGRFRLQVHLVRAEARRRRRETDARARGGLEKRQRHGFAAQRRQFFKRVPLDFLEGFRLVQQK